MLCCVMVRLESANPYTAPEGASDVDVEHEKRRVLLIIDEEEATGVAHVAVGMGGLSLMA